MFSALFDLNGVKAPSLYGFSMVFWQLVGICERRGHKVLICS